MNAVGVLLLLLRLPLHGSTAAATAGGPHLPRSYYRFEDAADLMKDSAPAALHLVPTGKAIPAAKTLAEGGQVGGWMQLDGCGANWNRSLWANASQLPRQCTGQTPLWKDHRCNTNYPCAAMPGGKKGGCCCNSSSDPQGKITGITVEWLMKLGRCAKLNGNLTLFDTGASSRYGGGLNSRTWIDLSRHGFTFGMETSATARVGSLMQAQLNGTGRSSTQYLHNDQWHHIVVRYSSGGFTGQGKLDAWIDGKIPASPDAWFSREGTPTPSWPWQLTNLKPSGYFAQWTGGVWPSLRVLPSPFDGGIDEVALYEEALPDALIVQHYQDVMDHKPYSSSVHLHGAGAAVPPSDPAPSLNVKEYPPGTTLPTPKVTGCGKPHCVEQPTLGVKISPLAQLQSYPLPRYQSPPTGKLKLQKLGECCPASFHQAKTGLGASPVWAARLPCSFHHSSHTVLILLPPRQLYGLRLPWGREPEEHKRDQYAMLHQLQQVDAPLQRDQRRLRYQ